MTTIIVKDASYTATHTLFTGLNLSIGPDDRIGLVAGNGVGKSTLLKCLAGELDLTSGQITASRGARIGYVEQHVDEKLAAFTFLEAVTGALDPEIRESESWRADLALDTLGVPDDMRSVRVAALSGGWQKLMLLARVWVTDPDVLLLDEPTNHLDLEKIALLENWLQTGLGPVPVVIASHDRAFLDAVTNRTLFLRPETSRYFSLPYSRARDALAQDDAADAVRRERDLKEASQLRQQSAKLKNIGINSGSDLLQRKQKQLREHAEKIEDNVKTLHRERPGDIKLANRGTHARLLIALDNLSITTPGGQLLFAVPKLHIFQGDRVVVLGRNGSGKSSLIRLLRSVLVEGRAVDGIRASGSLVTGYMDQGLEIVPAGSTPFDFISGFGLGDQRTRALLAGAGIAVEKQDRPVSALSYGQRSRLGLLALRLAEPNFYLLDEPTNHVDIAGQEALAEEIIAHEASCILVSHDRAFVREVGTRFVVIEGKRLVEADGPEPFFASVSV